MRLLSGALLTLVSAGILSAKVKPDILPQDDALRKALAFHASFDGQVDAFMPPAIRSCTGLLP